MGLAIGLVLALGVGQLIASQLYGVAPWDPVTLGGVLLLFVSVSVLASLVPAARAARTSPVEVLRVD